MGCKKLGIELLLIALFAVMAIGFIVTYVVAVHNNHVSPYFPYISDTGSEAPESCIFGFICSIGAILVMFIVYIRHKQVYEFYSKKGIPHLTCLNYFASMLGALAVLGLLLVGSFQDDKVAIVHFIGAYLVFGFGMLYGWVQLIIAFKISSSLGIFKKCLLLFKLLVLIVGTTCFVGTMVIGSVISKKYKGDNACVHCWDKNDGGYGLHVASTAMEWLMSLCFLLYFLTFHSDFTNLSVEVTVKARYHFSDGYSANWNADERTLLT